VKSETFGIARHIRVHAQWFSISEQKKLLPDEYPVKLQYDKFPKRTRLITAAFPALIRLLNFLYSATLFISQNFLPFYKRTRCNVCLVMSWQQWYFNAVFRPRYHWPASLGIHIATNVAEAANLQHLRLCASSAKYGVICKRRETAWLCRLCLIHNLQIQLNRSTVMYYMYMYDLGQVGSFGRYCSIRVTSASRIFRKIYRWYKHVWISGYFVNVIIVFNKYVLNKLYTIQENVI